MSVLPMASWTFLVAKHEQISGRGLSFTWAGTEKCISSWLSILPQILGFKIEAPRFIFALGMSSAGGEGRYSLDGVAKKWAAHPELLARLNRSGRLIQAPNKEALKSSNDHVAHNHLVLKPLVEEIVLQPNWELFHLESLMAEPLGGTVLKSCAICRNPCGRVDI